MVLAVRPDGAYFSRYLYTLILAIDANFHLRRRAISNEVRDPAIGSGWGYFVESNAYKEYYMQHATQDDVSHTVFVTDAAVLMLMFR